ncbi:hypothetical protein [Aquimarina litoralis]|uniref:hypothetical protein n=1 Tax=Aquimarina litoralis TaxID=584605 RepID=UPI001C55CDA9|nr:hypothetical protein [Aquimarina litoralis]MBW1296683.1 hypothetical protein [Aquimarina litoralis]
MKNLNKIFALLFLVTIISCEDESKNPLPDFAASQGSFIRFVNEVAPATLSYEDPTAAGFSLPIEDVNENTSSYTLDMVATIGGNVSTVENFLTIDSFPTTLTINAQMIADALNLELTDLNFGDNFAFIAEAVRNDGVAFTGQVPAFDPDTGILSGGNTSSNLLGGVYRNAMNFNFTFACPAFDIAELAGTYDVTTNLLAPGLGLTDPDPTREVIVGPGASQITIVGGSVGFAGGDDLVLDVDTSFGGLTLGADGVAFPVGAGGLTFDSDYGPLAGSPAALALTCTADTTLTIPVTLTCCGGVWTLVLTKQ